MKTYILGLYDRASADHTDMPILEFPPIEAESQEEAKEKLFSQVVRLEILELDR